MIKTVIAIVFIFLTAGAWIYLDCMNKREQDITAQAQQGVLQARAESTRRAEVKANFEKNILDTLNNCQAAAEKAKTDYMALIQKVAPVKRGQVLIPQAVTDETETILTNARAECQLSYNARVQKGL